MYDLRVHGFVDCMLQRDLSFSIADLPTWRHLISTKRKMSTLHTLTEHLVKPIDVSGQKIIPQYEWHRKLDEGTYGKVYAAVRTMFLHDISGNYKADNKSRLDIVIKKSPLYLNEIEQALPLSKRNTVIAQDIAAHIHEATVMTLAYLAVKDTAYAHSIPIVFEVFVHSKTPLLDVTDISSVCIAMEYIHGNTLLEYLTYNFDEVDNQRNDEIFIEFLEQIANVIAILQDKLRMNHRDMKINNILLRNSKEKNPKLVLIDYGFACLANKEEDPKAEYSKVEAGSYFGSKYACMKVGRDICQFIYSIHCHFNLDKFLSAELLTVIQDLMMVDYSGGIGNLLNGLDVLGIPHTVRSRKLTFDEDIYIFLRRPEVDPIKCSPENVLKVIADFKKKLES